MKVTGKILAVLGERKVTTTKGELRKRDFILEVSKPNIAGDKQPHPDTIGLSLTGDMIDTTTLVLNGRYTIIYDSDTHISASGQEVFTRNRVFKADYLDD